MQGICIKLLPAPSIQPQAIASGDSSWIAEIIYFPRSISSFSLLFTALAALLYSKVIVYDQNYLNAIIWKYKNLGTKPGKFDQPMPGIPGPNGD